MPSRFRFHGYAIGAAGRIHRPFSELIEVQAATALPQIGGHGSARSARFKYRDIFQFDVAHSEVTGAPCHSDCDDKPASYGTHIQATLEGLNVMGMVTADRVVANLASTYGPASDGEPSVVLVGTRFENLRIAGIPVHVDLATDVFDRYPTHRALVQAYRTDEGVRGLFDRVTLKDHAHQAPEHILRWFSHSHGGAELPATRGITSVSLVRELAAEKAGLELWGHVIHVPGFGTVRLAEIDISRVTRTVNMIQIDLDCPYKAQIMCAMIADGGEGY